MPKKAQKKPRIKLDINNMMKEKLGSEGLGKSDISRIMPRLKAAAKTLRQKRDDAQLGFMLSPYDVKSREEVKKLSDRTRREFDNIVVVAMGGYTNAVNAVHRACRHSYYNLLPAEKRKAPRLFTLDNPDPETAAALLDILDIKKTCINIISRSGETPEVAAFFKFLWKRTVSAAGAERAKDHFVFTTDKDAGVLKQIAGKNNITVLAMQPDVGGRFSALTCSVLFPLACCGINIDELLKGAAFMDSALSTDNVWENPAYMRAALHYLSDIKFKRRTCVMMPYPDSLSGIASWNSQLVAGSLAKKFSGDKRILNTGLSPLTAMGVPAQHSLLQLFTEGPYDKVVTFIRPEKFRQETVLPSNFDEFEAMSYLNSGSMGGLLAAQQKATAYALLEAQRPSMEIIMPEITEFTIGQLLYMLEVETVFLAELYNINAFDQPGAESGNAAAFALMGRRSHRQVLDEFRKYKDNIKYKI